MKKVITYIFLAIITILTAIIEIIDFGGYKFDTTYLKYIGIIICFIYSLFNIKKDNCYLISIGLGLTLVADYFLLVIDNYYEIGVSVFLIVQLIYLLYLSKGNNIIKSLIIRVVIFIVLLIVLICIKQKDILVILSILYYINLLANIYKAIKVKFNGHIILAIGFILFSLCDLCVGLHNILDFVSINNKVVLDLISFANNGMWLFYLPSQALISLSTYMRENSYEK